ncbi:hypothetical protein [Dactylosporangium sp. NPDC051541]|uniref:hypothetical protein n=1 Tax=Dactylosporangium sp. NPDC051541 TaxID=3363977 RepID=UPI003797EE8F
MNPAADGDSGTETGPAPALRLLLTLDAGERFSGTVGVLGTATGRTFHGWVDLIGAVEALRASTDRPPGA